MFQPKVRMSEKPIYDYLCLEPYSTLHSNKKCFVVFPRMQQLSVNEEKTRIFYYSEIYKKLVIISKNPIIWQDYCDALEPVTDLSIYVYSTLIQMVL